MNAIEKTWGQAWEPIDRRPIYEVLSDDLVFGNESPFPGAFDIRNSPAMKAPLDALSNDEVRRVSVSAAAQMFKTLLGLVFVIYCIKKRPGLTTWNGQTKDAISKVCEDKAWPLFRRCKSLDTLMPGDRHKKRTRSIVFPHMSLRFQSASENNAHSDTVKNQINDERHLWLPGMIHKFLSRVGSMPDHRVLDLSTGSVKIAEEKLADGTVIEIGDDFFTDWHSGTQEVWHVRCPKCRQLQPLAWKHARPDADGKPVFGIAWDENEKTRPGGRWNFAAVRQTARWRCLLCRHGVADSRENRRALNALENGATYVAQNPDADPRSRSFRAPAMSSELVEWGTLVVEWIKATEAGRAGDYLPLKTFIQHRLAEAWDESVTLTAASNPTGDYEIGDEWKVAGELAEDRRFLTVDRQAGRGSDGVHFWALARCWSRDHGSRLLAFRRLESYAEIRAMQTELAIPDKRVLIDAGDESNEVYTQCAKFGWTALMGRDREYFAWPNPRQPRKPIRKLFSTPGRADPMKGKRKKELSRTGTRYARLIQWCTPGVRDILAALIAGNSTYWGRPKDEPEDYADQLNSEIKKQVRGKGGRLRWIWQQIRLDNHGRDCEAMQLVAALISGLIDTSGGADMADEEEQPTLDPPRNVPARKRQYRLK